jgi:hypothetical protein
MCVRAVSRTLVAVASLSAVAVAGVMAAGAAEVFAAEDVEVAAEEGEAGEGDAFGALLQAAERAKIEPKPEKPAPVVEEESGRAVPERELRPERGVIEIDGGRTVLLEGAHWWQMDYGVELPRWGRYAICLEYELEGLALRVQGRVGEQRVRGQLPPADAINGGERCLGSVYFEKAGPQMVSLYLPPEFDPKELRLHTIRLVPAPEGEAAEQGEDGRVELMASRATTWSENMRYEPMLGKDCLGFWTKVEDFAEWGFWLDEPGKFRVVVTQGCGAGNGGSEVAVEVGEQKVGFVVKETGGYQEWAEVEAGEVEIGEAGFHYLVVRPTKQAKGAIMDIRKVELVPVE